MSGRRRALSGPLRWFGERLRRKIAEPLFPLSLAGAGGILVSEWAGAEKTPFPWLWAWGGLAGALAVMAVRAGNRRRFPAVCALTAAVFALAHALNGREPVRESVEERLAPGASTAAEVTGIVADAPEMTSREGIWRFPLRVERLTVGDADWRAADARLFTVWVEPGEVPAYGDRVTLSGFLRRPEGRRNPGEFDFPAYLRVNGFAAEFFVEGGARAGRVVARGEGNPVMALALRCRDWIAATVTGDLEDDPVTASAIRTMMLGTREKTPEEIVEAFRASGTMHVFAVSGLHVGLFAAIAWFFLRTLGLRRGCAVALSVGLMFFYVYVTGLRPSAWRAAIMSTLLLAAPLAKRESNLLNGLGAAALLLTAWDTMQLFQPGFVLSFGVLLALAFLYEPFKALAGVLLGRWNAPDPFLPPQLWNRRQAAWYWARNKFCEALGLSTASTLGMTPLMIGYFRLVTPVGIVANLFLVLLSTWMLLLGCCSLLSAAAGLKAVAVLFNNANWGLAWTSIALAKFFAGIPGGNLRVDPARLWRGAPCEVTVLALDRGGGAARVDTPEGRQWLVDCGGARHFRRTVRPHLERAPVNALDGLVLTHRDSSHTGALEELLPLFSPAKVWRNADVKAPDADVLRAGQILELDSRTRLEVLHPPADWNAGLADDRCLVLRLEYGGRRVLFMGDAGFPTEKALLESGADLRADVLVKGRHASDFSGLPEFLNAVNPAVIVYSNARYPREEAVPPEWVEMARGKGIALFDQSRTGGVTIRLEQSRLTVKGFVNGLEFTAGR